MFWILCRGAVQTWAVGFLELATGLVGSFLQVQRLD